MDVLWISQNYDNLKKVVWMEEIQPRFGHLGVVEINQNDMRLTLPGKGSLFLQSAESINNILGMGGNVGGIILDEGAKYPLKEILQTQVLPILLDNDGWLITTSTPNCGYDGNKVRTSPSGFNEVCIDINAGKRPAWHQWHATAFDNPYLSREAIEELIAEYPEGSLQLREEVYAELVEGGAGRALADLNWERHIVEPFEPESWWTHWGSFDWGYDHNWVFCHFVQNTGGQVFLVESAWGRQDLPDEIAHKALEQLGQINVKKRMYVIACGHDTWYRDQSKQANVPTTAERLIANGISKLDKANTEKVAGLNNMREYLSWKETPARKERIPTCRIMDTPNNRRLFDQLEHLLLDPKEPDKPFKVNAVQGKGGDDGADAFRYGLAARPVIPNMKVSNEIDNLWSPEVLIQEYDRGHRVKHLPEKDLAPVFDDPFGNY